MKYKSISPLISIILLIVVAIVIVTIILTWGRSYTQESLDLNQFIIFEKSNLEGFIKQNTRVPSKNIILENLHSSQSATIVGYKIHSEKDAFYLNRYLYLEEDFSLSSITINPNEMKELYMVCYPKSEFYLELLLENNEFLNLKIINNSHNILDCNEKGLEPLPYISFNDEILLYVYPVNVGFDGRGQWGCRGQNVFPNTSWEDGKTNTENLILWHSDNSNFNDNNYFECTSGCEAWNCSSSNNGIVAAKICDDLVFEVEGVIYDDWYLPAAYQLETLGKGSFFVDDYSFVKDNYFSQPAWEDYNFGTYWTSTEFTTTNSIGYAMVNAFFVSSSKASTNRIRCVRDP